MEPRFLDRAVNQGFSGGERKRNEVSSRARRGRARLRDGRGVHTRTRLPGRCRRNSSLEFSCTASGSQAAHRALAVPAAGVLLHTADAHKQHTPGPKQLTIYEDY